jgi:hypothetical protein
MRHEGELMSFASIAWDKPHLRFALAMLSSVFAGGLAFAIGYKG